jgi:hypothetical protein
MPIEGTKWAASPSAIDVGQNEAAPMREACLMRGLIFLLWAGALLAAASGWAADGAHAVRPPGGDVVFHYGVVPAEVVLKHAEPHAERQMHGTPPRGSSHVVVALFDAKGDRIGQAEVIATVTLAGGPSQTKRLEPMDIAGRPSFGNFFHMGTPGAYCLRFLARRPGQPLAASREFECRVAPEGQR